MSSGSSWYSFVLGARWGCGHSLGLIATAILFISLDGKFDFTSINFYTDVLVGVFMIVLGLYGVREGVLKVSQTYRDRLVTVPGSEDGESKGSQAKSVQVYLSKEERGGNVVETGESIHLEECSMQKLGATDHEVLLGVSSESSSTTFEKQRARCLRWRDNVSTRIRTVRLTDSTTQKVSAIERFIGHESDPF